jgi:hypothetical protein
MAEAVSAVATAESAREAKQVRTVIWVMSLALVGLLFDGYDLVPLHRGLDGLKFNGGLGGRRARPESRCCARRPGSA